MAPHALKPLQRLVLIALIEHAPKIEPSIARLEIMTGLSRRTVQAQLQSLESAGVLRVEHRHGKRSAYSVDLDQCIPCARAGAAPVQELRPTRAGAAPPPVQELHPKQTSKADKKADKGSLGSASRKGERRRKPEPPLHEGWKPSEQHGEMARRLGVDLELEASQFPEPCRSERPTAAKLGRRLSPVAHERSKVCSPARGAKSDRTCPAERGRRVEEGLRVIAPRKPEHPPGSSLPALEFYTRGTRDSRAGCVQGVPNSLNERSTAGHSSRGRSVRSSVNSAGFVQQRAPGKRHSPVSARNQEAPR